MDIKQFRTAQLLKVTQNGDKTTKEYAVTTFGVICPMGSVVREDDKWDNSYSVRAYSTIYVLKSTCKGSDCYKLQYAEGGWDIADGSVSVSGRKVILGSSGTNPNNGLFISQDVTYYPSSNTYFYDAPYMDWTYIVRNSYMNVGSTSFATLKRGTSSWKLTLTNNY